MSDTPQQYILRQPITRDGGSDDEDFGGYYIYTGESSDAHAFIYPDGFDALFVPLDVQALREQIADIMDELGEYRDVEAYFRKQDEAVDAVLRVCGLTQEETDV